MGKSMLALMTWLALRLLLQEEVVIHENVIGFPPAILVTMLGHIYHVFPLELGPNILGHPVCRARRITILVHKSSVALVANGSPWADMAILCSRRLKPTFSWRAYFLASQDELKGELQWAEGRVGCYRHLNAEEKAALPEEIRRLAELSQFTKALTISELKTWSEYMRLRGRGGVYNLNQTPGCRDMYSTGQCLNTLISNSGMVMSDAHKRWMTPYEKLLTQGFAVFPEVCPEGVRCSFLVQREALGLSPRRRNAIAFQAGNAMHTNVIGVAILWVLSFTAARQDAGDQESITKPLVHATRGNDDDQDANNDGGTRQGTSYSSLAASPAGPSAQLLPSLRSSELALPRALPRGLKRSGSLL